MLLAIVAAVGAALVGRVRGGSLDALAATKLRWPVFLVAGLGLQIGFALWSPSWTNEAIAVAVVIASDVLVGVFVVANRRLAGMVTIGMGLLLNLVVIAANGAMPVSPGAARIAGARVPGPHPDIKHERLGRATILPLLGDVIPLPHLGEVMSVGDVVLAIGIARLVYLRTTSGDDRAS
jgi:hypothetical protein